MKKEVFSSNQLKKILTLAVRGTYLISIVGFVVVKVDALQEGPRGTARPPPLIGSLAC
jgi:hypothetical protein